MNGPIRWPDGKDFAFTIFDDCDHQTAENVRAVYDFITEIGLRTTKTVWTVRGSEKPEEKVTNGSTCDDEAYLKWALELQTRGFEIALHNISYHTSPRERTLRVVVPTSNGPPVREHALSPAARAGTAAAGPRKVTSVATRVSTCAAYHPATTAPP